MQYDFNLDNSIQLPGSHGDELVRDMFTDVQVCNCAIVIGPELTIPQTRTTFTCGEDGFVRAWKASGDESMSVDEDAEPSKKSKDKDRKEKRKEKKDKKKGGEKDKARYKPY